MEKYLLKMSSAGNRFLIADKYWFEHSLTSEWKEAVVKTNKNFEEFLKLAELSFSERKVFMEDLIFQKECSLADGLVVLKGYRDSTLICDFYNKDGSQAEMCGNAVCCLSLYVEEFISKQNSYVSDQEKLKEKSLSQNATPPIKKILLGKELVSWAKGGGVVWEKAPEFLGLYEFKASNEALQNPKGQDVLSSVSQLNHLERDSQSQSVKIQSKNLKDQDSITDLQTSKTLLQNLADDSSHTKVQSQNPETPNSKTQAVGFTFIKAGVPHGVIDCSSEEGFDLDNKDLLKKVAQKIRGINLKNHKGMNVSFFQEEKHGYLKALTFERGVEGFTLACGTGAVAVAFAYRRQREKQIKIQNKSQKLLENQSLTQVFVNMPGGQLRVQFEPEMALFSPAKKDW